MTARRWAHAHLILTLVWIGLLAPTLLWWRSSILWIAAMSLYANVAGHAAAWQAARAEHATNKEDT